MDDGRASERAIIQPGRGSMMLRAKPTQLDLLCPDHGKTVKLGRESTSPLAILVDDPRLGTLWEVARASAGQALRDPGCHGRPRVRGTRGKGGA